MGVDYTAKLTVGYRIKKADLDSRFLVVTPAKWHQEPRFDPTTGVEAPPETVIDEPEKRSYVAKTGNRSFECGWVGSLIEDICEVIGAKYVEDGSYMCGEDGMEWIIGPDITVENGRDEGKVNSGGEIKLSALYGKEAEIVRIGETLLVRFGLNVGEPIVISALHVS